MDTHNYLVAPSLVSEGQNAFTNVPFGDEPVEQFPEFNQEETSQDILAETHLEVPSILFNIQPDNVKIEEIEMTNNELSGSDTMNDENVAVEALRQLGNSAMKKPKLDLQKEDLRESYLNVFQNEELLKTNQEDCFTCMICNDVFNRKSDFNNHLVCHAVGRPHACRICGTLFIQKKDLNQHMSLHKSPTISHQCKVCGQQFNRPSSLSNHLKIHNYQPGRGLASLKIPGNYELADILTGNDAELPSVQKSLPSISNITITNLNWNLNYESDLHVMEHMNLGDLNPNYLEKFDDVEKNMHFVIVERDESKLSNARVANKKLHFCAKCGKSFIRQKALLSHMKIHNDLPVSCSTCSKCDQDFPNNNTLQRHFQFCGVKSTIVTKNPHKSNIPADPSRGEDQETETANAEKTNPDSDIIYNELCKHNCNQCNKSFSTKQKLYRHIWIHRKKTYSCEVCGDTFDMQAHLDSHRLSTHQTITPYGCSQCGKHFYTRQGLYDHTRLHVSSEMSPFRCKECDKNFASRQGYLIHKRKHSDERPYGCKFCYKSFRDGGTLRKHERIHTGERPHACPLCPKAFNQKVVLREHLRWVHVANMKRDADGNLKCELCTKIFSDKEELCAHFVTHSDQMALLAKELARDASKSNVSTGETNKSAEVTKSKDKYLPKEDVDDPALQKKELKVECNDETDVQCDLCGLFFKSRSDLSSHIHVHI